MDWQPITEGYELTRITRSDGTHPRPQCDHLIDTPQGPAVHCMELAVFGLPAPEDWRDYRSYTCARHKGDNPARFAGAEDDDE